MLRKGDILTHCCRPDPNSIIDQGVVMDAAWRAKERGIYFDIGHGMGGFSYQVCRQMLSEGFLPDMISSDVHCLSVHGPAVDLLTTINKLMALGVPLEHALKSTTEIPAKSMRKDSLGRIRVGDTANISILKHSNQAQVFTDAVGETISSADCLAPVALISKGKVAFSNTLHTYEE
jgi:dihydroorotase